MGSPLIYPKFQGIAPNPTGAAAAGYKLKTFAAGTSTPQATYTDSTLAVANPVVVVMDANGEANVWLGQLSYKFVFTDPADVVQWTVDNVTQASLGALQSEWVALPTPTFVSATSFTVDASINVAAAPYFIAIGTRTRTVNSGGTVYSTVRAVAGNLVTLRNDSGVLDVGISSAAYGIITNPQNSSPARWSRAHYINGTNVNLVNATPTFLTTGGTVVADYLGEVASATFVPLVAGTYHIYGHVLFNEGAATTGIQNIAQSVHIAKNGVAQITSTINWIPAASIAQTQAIPFNGTLTLAAADNLTIMCTGNFTGTAPTASLASLNIERVL